MPGVTSPGWYPDPYGGPAQRYWDGQAWTAHVAPGQLAPVPYPGAPEPPLSAADERMWAMFSHLGGLFFGFLAPLLILLILGKRSAFVRDQATESLNFRISYAVAMVASLLLCLVLIGFVLFPVVAIGGAVLTILGSIEANKGVRYRYPINIRFIR